MSRYIRTEDRIYDGSLYLREYTGWYFNEESKFYAFTESEIIKQADTIEELCDDFILDNGYKHYIENGIVGARRTKQFSVEHGHKVHIYGGIWTNKGFTYVAEMNDKGELELL